MNLLTPFTVLLERRRLLRAAVSLLTSVAMILPGVGLPIAQAHAEGDRPRGRRDRFERLKPCAEIRVVLI